MLRIVLVTELGKGGIRWRERPSLCLSLCKKTISAPIPIEKSGGTRASTRGWEEAGVWMGRLEHRVWVLLWGPSHPHFAFHDSCCICASTSCWNGPVPQKQIVETIFEEDFYRSCNKSFSPLLPVFTVFPICYVQVSWPDSNIAPVIPIILQLFWQYNKVWELKAWFSMEQCQKIQKIWTFKLILNPQKFRLNSSQIFLTFHAFLYQPTYQFLRQSVKLHHHLRLSGWSCAMVKKINFFPLSSVGWLPSPRVQMMSGTTCFSNLLHFSFKKVQWEETKWWENSVWVSAENI